MTETIANSQSSVNSITALKSRRFDLTEPISWICSTVTYILLLFISVWLHGNDIINHDVAWLMIAAERWLNGSHYGSEIVEINTPAAMLLYVPPVWAAKTTGVGFQYMVDLWLGLVALIAAILTGRAAAAVGKAQANSRHAFISTSLVFCIFTFYPTTEFAQRDHFIALTLLPYGLMAANGLKTQFCRAERLAAGLMTALALCIKPQYLVVVSAIFIFVVLEQTTIKNWRQVLWNSCRLLQLPLLVPIGAIYIIVVALFFSDWLKLALDFGHVFSVYSRSVLITLLGCSTSIIALIMAGAAISFPFPGKRYLLTCFVLAIGTFILVQLEGEPWLYHQLPILLFLYTGAALAVRSFAAATGATGAPPSRSQHDRGIDTYFLGADQLPASYRTSSFD